jgi:hypothetical protein
MRDAAEESDQDGDQQVIEEMLRNVIAGKGIDPSKLTQAFEVLISSIVSGVSAKIDPRWMNDKVWQAYQPAAHAGRGARPGQAHRSQSHRARDSGPTSRSRTSEQDAALSARKVMGFASAEPLDAAKIKDRRRQLAKKHHPDLGGSAEKMKAVNDAADVLIGSL